MFAGRMTCLWFWLFFNWSQDWILEGWRGGLVGVSVGVDQCGPLDVEIISEELLVMLRQLSYAIKNQLKAPKAPY